jgi:hypothetical protein
MGYQFLIKIKRLILVSVIQLSGGHCTYFESSIILNFSLYHFGKTGFAVMYGIQDFQVVILVKRETRERRNFF